MDTDKMLGVEDYWNDFSKKVFTGEAAEFREVVRVCFFAGFSASVIMSSVNAVDPAFLKREFEYVLDVLKISGLEIKGG